MSQCIKTTCAYCGVGCGIKAQIKNETTHQITIKGDTEHPANKGRLCSKGSALGDTVNLEDRLLTPKINGQEATWNAAINEVAERIQSVIKKHGPNSIALYGSGQLLTEDYYVANKLMKGFIGSANIDTNSRLCMASTVAGHKRAFGEDIVPGCYEDLEDAELIVLVGSNTAWCHPVLYQRIQASADKNSDKKIIVIDPRRTATCESADLHLPIKPGTDTTLFAGLLVWLADHHAIDCDWVASHTENFEQALVNARALAPSLKSVADTCDLPIASLQAFYSLFTATEKVVTAWSQGTNQGFDGTDRVNAMINVHLAMGRIGKPGSGPFSLTGQPNAMGGREVGGLANQLAAHMDFQPEDVDRVKRFWNAPNMVTQPGLTAVDMFDAIARGEIRFVWILGTNPAVSMPNADKVRAALEKCEHVVVSDCMDNTDTGAYANILFPAAPWSEKDGTVTNSERRISRQRALFSLAGEARPDWWTLAQVGRRLGYSGDFKYGCSADIFREHARLSAFENSKEERFRLFNLSDLQHISNTDYDDLQPTQWPANAKRLLANGKFSTTSGKAQLVVPDAVKYPVPDQHYPFTLNTGRIRDQWHTMTRTARAPQLNRHIYEPFVQVNPKDAAALNLKGGTLANLRSPYGKAVVRVQVDGSIKESQLFMPMHWTKEYCRGGLLGSLVQPVTDPVSRQPDSKTTPVSISSWQGDWYGVLITREKLSLPNIDYCALIRDTHIFRYELGGSGARHTAETLLPNIHDGHVMTLDIRVGMQSCAVFGGEKLMGVLFLSFEPLSLDREWLHQQFELEKADWRVLAGVAGSGQSCGSTVCACFGVGEKTIRDGIANGLGSVEAIGKTLKAGTNCGSCVPELKRYLLECENRLELAV